MATGTAGSTALRTHDQKIHTMMAVVAWNSPGTAIAKTIGVLPAGAVVVGGGVQVTTAFGASDTFNVGTSGDDDEYATNLDVSSKGFKVFDEMATHDGYSTSEVTVTATYTDSGADAAAGSAIVIVNFVIPSNYGL